MAIKILNGIDVVGSMNITASDIPSLDANKITTGTLAAGLIPSLDASKIGSGTLSASRIPNLDGSKITTGTIPAARIGDLSSTYATVSSVPTNVSELTNDIGYLSSLPSHNHIAENITGGILGQNGRIALANHPEGGAMLTPSFENDLAFVVERGGNVTTYITDSADYTALSLNNTGGSGFSNTIPFNGSTNYTYASLPSAASVVVYDIEMPFTLSYGNTWYVDFGAGAWQAKDVTFLAFHTDSNNSEQLYKVVGSTFRGVNSGLKFTYGSYSYIRTSDGGRSYGYNRLRVVMGNWDRTGVRIAAIGAKFYNSGSLTATLMSRGGGTMYGNLAATGTVTGSNLNISNWDTAYGWGNHASAGYLTTASAASTYAPKASPALTGTPTAPTASAATNTTQLATTAFVQTAVSNIVDSAPGALNTLNELAAALGDDANFSTTVTNSIATKLPLAGGRMTGGLTIDYAAGANPLLSLFNDSNGGGAKINFSDQSTPTQNGTLMYVHGDGNSYGTGNAFVFSSTELTMNVVALGNLMYRDGIYKTPSSGTGAGIRKDSEWDTAYGWGNHAGLYLGVTAKAADSNLLDGINSSSFVRSDADDTITGSLTISSSSPQLKFNDVDSTADDFWIHVNSNRFYILPDRDDNNAWDTPYAFILDNNDSTAQIYGQYAATRDWVTSQGFSTATGVANNADNYGSWNLKTNDIQRTTVGSGGDLNLVAGTNVSIGYSAGGTVTISSTDTNTTYSVGDGGLTQKNFTTTLKTKLDGIEAGANVTDTANVVAALTAGNNVSIAANGTISATNTDTVTSVGVSGSETAGTITLTAAGATTLSQSGQTIEIRSTNTEYTVGDGGLTEKNFTTALKTKLDGIEAGATADQTPTQILTAIKTVDGSGSGLDADTLDGNQATAFATAAQGTKADAALPRAGGTVTGNIVIDQDGDNGAIVYTYPGGVYVPKPNGASFATTSSSQTGAIAIKLPTTSWNRSDMISFNVDIYDYNGNNEGESVSLYVYGYQYSTGLWTNQGAVILSDRTDRDYTVRFGHDGTRHIVYIGETTSTWNYLQVTVRDFQAGYDAGVAGNYDNGWEIAVSQTSFSNLQKTSSDNYPVAKQFKTARNIALSGAVTGNANFDGSGNITIATTATADPTLTLSGDASGSATFTNLGNATLTVTVANDSHTHDGRYYTETEIDTLLGGYSATSHVHSVATTSANGFMSSTDKTKLDGIEAGADVTDAINVSAAGAMLKAGIEKSTAMKEFETTISYQDDWQNSPIAIRERGAVGVSQSDDRYSPNLCFHWGGRSSNSLWMNSGGQLNYGSYNNLGVPAADGTFKAGTLYAGAESITATKVGQWNTAYGWGNHASVGYLTAVPSGYATETYVGTQISNLVSSAPSTLDTLNELAAALGDDPNFATTVTNSIATKLPFQTYNSGTDLNTINRSTFGAISTGNASPNTNQNYSAVYSLGVAGIPNTLQLGTASDYNASGLWVRQYNQNAASPQGTGWQNWTKVWTDNDFANNSANWNTAYADRYKWNGGSSGLNAATGRTSLGLGTAATSNTGDFATAAQGTKADTAFGWGNHASAGYLTSYTETDTLASVTSRGASTTTSLSIRNLTSRTIVPETNVAYDLGTPEARWQIVFCQTLDSAGQHESQLQNPEGEKSVGDYATGTVLVWKGGKNIPCTEAADHMRMGIAVNGIDSPLVQGAEPVLVTGSVNEGDYLVTSSVEGHAKAITPQFMRQHMLFDCVIGKALESGEGDSHLIKTWINI